MGYFCHFQALCCFCLSASLEVERSSHFSQDILLADKYKEHEEASEKVETIHDPEEDLNIFRAIFTRYLAMVAVDDVMETGEGPENAKDGEKFAEEYLKSIVL